ncbi:MAG TPA: hypothetical protein PLQ98_00095 [Bacillota bacterium]|nr:hypothetical protein [Bacillota bacterium]
MDVVTHGGRCCGIKTIHGFPYLNPQTLLPARKAFGDESEDGFTDLCSVASNVGKTFHRPTLPEEPATARLDRLIAFVRQKRPSHMIEVVLNQLQYPYWKNELQSRGFRLVTTSVNSNTNYRIYVFHKAIYKGEDVSIEEAAKQVEKV